MHYLTLTLTRFLQDLQIPAENDTKDAKILQYFLQKLHNPI